MDLINNNKIMSEDTDLIEKVFCPNIDSLKGKITRRQIHLFSSTVDIPTKLLRANKEVIILLDSL